MSHGHGGTARVTGRRLGWSESRWVGWAELRAAQEVAVLRVGDRRLPVARHGMAVVVWVDDPPVVTGLDSSGIVLGAVPMLVSPPS